MTKTSSSLFLHAKNKAILFFAFFLLGCQMPSTTQHAAATMPPDAVTGQTSPVQANPSQQSVSEKSTDSSLSYNYADHNEPHSNKYASESAKLEQCQSQLDALKTMNPAKYNQMRNSFDYLMKGAAQYANLRQKINADTQDTVDALYRYRANLLCAQIAQTLLDGLTRRGEARP